jgi:hypothetical protein
VGHDGQPACRTRSRIGRCAFPLVAWQERTNHADSAAAKERVGVRRQAPSDREGEHRPLSRPSPTLRFLLGPRRHGLAAFRAFVRVEGDPPRPCRRERAAGGPPTVFGPRHRKRARWPAKGSAATGEGAGRGWTEPRAERHEARPHPGTSEEARSGTQGNRPSAETRVARVTRRGAAFSPRRAEQRPVTRVTRAGPTSWRRSAPVEPHRCRRSGAGRATSGRKGHVPDDARR